MVLPFEMTGDITAPPNLVILTRRVRISAFVRPLPGRMPKFLSSPQNRGKPSNWLYPNRIVEYD